MGDRAVVVFTDARATIISPTVYLHWHGSPRSVYALLDELDRRHVRTDGHSYEVARFVQLAANLLDIQYDPPFDHPRDSLSIGVDPPPPDLAPLTLKRLDPGDNGVYIVHRSTTDSRSVRRFVNSEFLSPASQAAEEAEAHAKGKEYTYEISRIIAHTTGEPPVFHRR